LPRVTAPGCCDSLGLGGHCPEQVALIVRIPRIVLCAAVPTACELALERLLAARAAQKALSGVVRRLGCMLGCTGRLRSPELDHDV
jgi:hypothetical protein